MYSLLSWFFCAHELGIRGSVLRTGDSNPGPCRSVVEPEPPFLAGARPVKKGAAPASALLLKLQR